MGFCGTWWFQECFKNPMAKWRSVVFYWTGVGGGAFKNVAVVNTGRD